MSAVAISTARRHRVAAKGSLAMQASFLFRGNGFVANTTVDQVKVPACRMTTLLRVEVTVTFHAGQVGVDRCIVNGLGDEHRHFLTAAGAREFGVAMTFEAIVIALGRREGRCEQETGCSCNKPTLSITTWQRFGVGWALARTQDSSLCSKYRTLGTQNEGSI